ncbi:lanthionine synthetase LanC family protein [Lacticaseibacillus suibinensis]|uniref:lanthionine synthetase LanC family protein n=1 Tax=Lacticaseibacillus suibinensis TaxID=2486011 RepID=UPI0019407942|nr:lanthionine synthetase LanC family protein [Lacticaseibacillus suibinensis]
MKKIQQTIDTIADRLISTSDTEPALNNLTINENYCSVIEAPVAFTESSPSEEANKKIEQLVSSLIPKIHFEELSLANINGLTNLALAIFSCRHLSSHLHEFSTAFIVKYCTTVDFYIESIPTNKKLDLREFDVINGMAGIANCLLILSQDSDCLDTLSNFVKLMLQLLDRSVLSDGLSDESLNLGFAHGLAGVQMVISRITKAGIIRDISVLTEMKDHVTTLSSFYMSKRQRIFLGHEYPIITWPYRDNRTTRYSWCFGGAGIELSLFEAALTLGIPEILEAVRSDMIEVSRVPLEYLELRNSTICHGLAGLLMIVTKMNRYYQDAAIARFSRKLTDEIIDRQQVGLKFLYQNYDEYFGGKLSTKRTFHDDVTLLNGVSGTLVALVMAKDNTDSIAAQSLLL